jgi:uncharacterized protein (TIGR00255 family)
MTGFGTSATPFGEGRLVVEVRSLNHRFLELRVRLPSELQELAFHAEQCCREQLQRGRVDVTVRLEGAALPAPGFDLERAKSLYLSLCRLRDEVAPGTEVPLSLLGSLSAALTREPRVDIDAAKIALSSVISEAIVGLGVMREREGAALRLELMNLLSRCQRLREVVIGRAPQLAEAFRERLRERVARALRQSDHPGVDSGRLESEVVLFADRADVTEELARLGSHFDQFASMCDETNPVGRRIEFLLQEISRETNTIGSKCADVQLSHAIVELKAELERIREQVQNVE